MKTIHLLFLAIILLFNLTGCTVKEASNMEEEVKKVIKQYAGNVDAVWHLEVKDNVIIAFYEKEQQLHLGFIKMNNNKWEWSIGSGSIDLKEGGYIATADLGLPFYLTAVVSVKEGTTEVTVQGEFAKLVQISPNKKLWLAFTEKPTTGKDIVTRSE